MRSNAYTRFHPFREREKLTHPHRYTHNREKVSLCFIDWYFSLLFLSITGTRDGQKGKYCELGLFFFVKLERLESSSISWIATSKICCKSGEVAECFGRYQSGLVVAKHVLGVVLFHHSDGDTETHLDKEKKIKT